MKRQIEFWAIDVDGNKYHEYITTKIANKTKIKKLIESIYDFDVDSCVDFGMRVEFEEQELNYR